MSHNYLCSRETLGLVVTATPGHSNTEGQPVHLVRDEGGGWVVTLVPWWQLRQQQEKTGHTWEQPSRCLPGLHTVIATAGLGVLLHTTGGQESPPLPDTVYSMDY